MSIYLSSFPMPGRVTQKQIASAAGVDPSTVSLALRDHPRIPKATREKVISAAQKLGYQRDPILGALAAYRQSNSQPGFHGVLGWLVRSTEKYSWKRTPEYREYFAGACERATAHGYQIEVHDLADYAARPNRLREVFKARGIRGVLICPLPRGRTSVDLDFSGLSAVAFGYSIKIPQLHLVTVDHFDAVQRCARELCTLGRKRIGLALSASHNERTNGAYLGAFVNEQATWPGTEKLPPYLATPSFESFREWFTQWRPDALITGRHDFPSYLEKLGVRIPEDVAVALVTASESLPNFAGIDEGSRTIGAVAVDILTDMVEHGQYGLPDRPRRTHLRGIWRPGPTVAVGPAV